MVAPLICVGWLVIFEDRFAVGATWSGLNPTGGGPGFLLIVTTGALSYFARSRFARTISVMPAIALAGVLAIICGVVFAPIAQQLPKLSDDAVAPLASAVIGSFFVPRVVAAVLEDSWARPEAERADARDQPVPRTE